MRVPGSIRLIVEGAEILDVFPELTPLVEGSYPDRSVTVAKFACAAPARRGTVSTMYAISAAPCRFHSVPSGAVKATTGSMTTRATSSNCTRQPLASRSVLNAQDKREPRSPVATQLCWHTTASRQPGGSPAPRAQGTFPHPGLRKRRRSRTGDLYHELRPRHYGCVVDSAQPSDRPTIVTQLTALLRRGWASASTAVIPTRASLTSTSFRVPSTGRSSFGRQVVVPARR